MVGLEPPQALFPNDPWPTMTGIAVGLDPAKEHGARGSDSKERDGGRMDEDAAEPRQPSSRRCAAADAEEAGAQPERTARSQSEAPPSAKRSKPNKRGDQPEQQQVCFRSVLRYWRRAACCRWSFFLSAFWRVPKVNKLACAFAHVVSGNLPHGIPETRPTAGDATAPAALCEERVNSRMSPMVFATKVRDTECCAGCQEGA